MKQGSDNFKEEHGYSVGMGGYKHHLLLEEFKEFLELVDSLPVDDNFEIAPIPVKN